MKFIVALLQLVCVQLFYCNLVFGRIVDRCELMKALYENGQKWEDLGEWLCVADAATGFNTSKLKETEGGRAAYGIYQLSNAYWCADNFGTKNLCRLNCHDLLDEYLLDDMRCAKMVFDDNGFKGWGLPWTQMCDGKNLKNYTEGCRIVEGQQPVKIITSKLEKEFIRGVENQYLACTAVGVPPPELEWNYNKTAFPQAFTKKEVSGSEKERTLKLIFPVTSTESSATFNCVAKNYVNSVTTDFKVVVVNAKAAGIPLAVVIPVTLVLLLVIFGVSLVVYRQYLRKGFIIIREQLSNDSSVVLIFNMYLIWEPSIKEHGLSKEEIQAFRNGAPEKLKLSAFAHENSQYQPYDQSFEIEQGKLNINTDDVLGSGQFGMVLKGEFEGKTVAVKTLQDHAETLYLKALLSELKVMIHIGRHPNIVQLIGAQTQELDKGLVFIAVEFCPYGDLEKYLRKQRGTFVDLYNVQPYTAQYENFRRIGITTRELVVWAVQIASAMNHLETRKVIHGDLACRNVLLYENSVVKVTDFGLSRQLYEYTNYVKKQQAPLPWKWMAIESLTTLTFSSQSDVWSFGVTLWEMFTLGDLPYPGLSWNLEFPILLENGTRLLKPKYGSDAIYEVILKCWNIVPESRTTFKELHDWFATHATELEIIENKLTML